MRKHNIKKGLLYVMSVLYIGAGINHFISTKLYLSIMPPWLPWHVALVYLSGVLESIGGLLLLPRVTRRFAAFFIIFLLIVIFPANVQMMLNYYQENNPHVWITIVRLPLQLVLIYWAYIYTKQDDI